MTLFDRTSYQLFQPLLHLMATGIVAGFARAITSNDQQVAARTRNRELGPNRIWR